MKRALREYEAKKQAVRLAFVLKRVDKKDANEILKNQQDLKLYIGFMTS